jgi:hypothetical protein
MRKILEKPTVICVETQLFCKIKLHYRPLWKLYNSHIKNSNRPYQKTQILFKKRIKKKKNTCFLAILHQQITKITP